jgi:hypothetical protein
MARKFRFYAPKNVAKVAKTFGTQFSALKGVEAELLASFATSQFLANSQ